MRAIILMGHSSSGKSPVGEALERELSVPGRACVHLDFGELLRRTVDRAVDPGLSADELAVIETFMQGRLLDDSTFYLAEKIIRWFLCDRKAGPGDMVVLNGIPRHTGQARSLARAGFDVVSVVHLDCTPEVAWERKKRAEQGAGFEDRSARPDQAPETFRTKIASFIEETMPMLQYYREAGVPIHRVAVGVETSPEEVVGLVMSEQ